jgi:DNA anti-recombination protein RmuC
MGAAMTTNQQSTAPANLAPLVIDLIRQVRTLKGEYAASAELLALALDQIRDLSTKLDIARGNSAARAEDSRRLHAEIKVLKAELTRLHCDVQHASMQLPSHGVTEHGAVQ